jgi:hypothetical protein
MSKYVFIKTADNSAYMNTADNFRGAVHSANLAVDIFFKAAGSGIEGAFDKITLVTVADKEQEVMDAIGGALAGSHSKGMVVIADDVAGSYVNANISSVNSFSLASTGQLAQVNVENKTADETLTASDSGKVFVFNDVDGAVLTLPDSGAGDIIGWTATFILGVTATSNAHKVVNADTTNEKIYGVLHMSDSDSSDATVGFAALDGDGFSAISSNGTTTGIQGSIYTLTNIAADKWQVEGTMIGTGSVATPLAAS